MRECSSPRRSARPGPSLQPASASSSPLAGPGHRGWCRDLDQIDAGALIEALVAAADDSIDRTRWSTPWWLRCVQAACAMSCRGCFSPHGSSLRCIERWLDWPGREPSPPSSPPTTTTSWNAGWLRKQRRSCCSWSATIILAGHHHVSVVLCCYAFVIAERVRHSPPPLGQRDVGRRRAVVRGLSATSPTARHPAARDRARHRPLAARCPACHAPRRGERRPAPT
jgi:hypothetical protein